MKMSQVIDELFQKRGSSQYGKEAVTQLEHGLQAAYAAEKAHASDATIVAALLHDVGHLLHDLPDDAPNQGIDDRHEELGYDWLEEHFGDEVTQPVRLHVAAKRYLCAVEPRYYDALSEPSQTSLRLQGGPLSPEEIGEFEQNPHYKTAVELRRWDDGAKIPNLETPPLEHYLDAVDRVAKQTTS